jgi:hypothetical protein
LAADANKYAAEPCIAEFQASQQEIFAGRLQAFNLADMITIAYLRMKNGA